MNKAKLALTVAFIAFITTISNRTLAQEKHVTIGIKAGVNLSTFGGNLKDVKSIFKYQGGLTADIVLSNNLYILTGLDLQTKGAKFSTSSSTNLKYNAMYLQIPVSLGYKFNLNANTKLVVNAGPYAAYGIGGKIEHDGIKESIFSDNKFKKFDYGLIGGAGVEFGKIALNVGYEYGLANVNTNGSTKIKNKNAYLTVGYKF